MTWSTRELADLAGTTVNTIRHYHSLGLLDVPDRRYNGYKQYRVCHLVRLLQVRRIAELGLPLAQVEAASSDGSALLAGLQQIDEDVSLEIERLRRTRSDIAAILRVHAPMDTPRGFETIVGALSEADLALIHILTRLSDDGEEASLREMVTSEPDDVRLGFYALRDDASDADRDRVANGMSGTANWRSVDRAWSTDIPRGQKRDSQRAREAIAAAVNELYNAAQRDVLRRTASRTARRQRPFTASGTPRTQANLAICA
ncbi:MAG: MerR family transcriptional regulator [Microbacterium sp.]